MLTHTTRVMRWVASFLAALLVVALWPLGGGAQGKNEVVVAVAP